MFNKNDVVVETVQISDNTVGIRCAIEKELIANIRATIGQKRIDRMINNMKEQLMCVIYNEVDDLLIDIDNILRKLANSSNESMNNFDKPIISLLNRIDGLRNNWRRKE